MHVSRLSLSDFRSYADCVLAPGPGFVILTGENGVGKTNVLEAVSLLSPGRGLRGASLSEMARKGGPGGFSVAARLALPLDGGGLGGGGVSERAPPSIDVHPTPTPPHQGEGAKKGGTSEIDIGTGTLAAAPERRQVRINGAPASANSLSEWLSVLWLTPAMDRLFADAASGRRRFLDRLVLALRPDHAGHSARYEAAMRARNKLLGEGEPWDEAWLAALEARMAEHGAVIAEARAATIAALAERLEAAPATPPPAGRSPARIAPTFSSPIKARPSPPASARRASRRRFSSASSSPSPISSPSAPIAARSSSSTRSPPISTQRAAPPCSGASPTRAGRSG